MLSVMNPRRTIYLDNNATTRLDPRVFEVMLPLLTEHWGNGSSQHHVGQPVTKAITAARRQVADLLGVTPGEVVFTASGTEADNIAIRGVVLAAAAPRHVVTTAVEHPAVLETCRDLESQGLCEVTVVGVDGDGNLDLEDLRAALRPQETCLVSVMWANNETGVVFPIAEVATLAHEAGAKLHVDAVQAMGKIEVNLAEVPVDLLAFSAHKIHGPKGMGGLVVRPGTKLHASMTGGGQERGRRSGTENPAGIVGLAKALELAVQTRAETEDAIRSRRGRIEAAVTQIAGVAITGAGATRVPNTLHMTVPGVEAEPMLLLLDREGIACSSGSACSSGALEPSHVLAAMNLESSRLHGALRLSLSRETTDADVDHVIATLPPIVQRIASITQDA